MTGRDPWCDARGATAGDVERDVVAVRGRLDYPQQGSRFGYVAAVEALDRLATLAHKKRRAAETLLQRAAAEPLGIDIADYSDEFCAGFLAGQVNALEHLDRLEDDSDD